MRKRLGKIVGILLVAMLFVSMGMGVVSAKKGIMQGDELTTFDAMTLDGEKFRLGHQGYPMVINFWATWCPPCRSEMPEFQKFSEKHPGVEMYLVSLEESPQTIRSFMRSEGLNLSPVIDPTGDAANYYRVTAIPTTLVVNRDGIIIYRKVGVVTAKELESVLGL